MREGDGDRKREKGKDLHQLTTPFGKTKKKQNKTQKPLLNGPGEGVWCECELLNLLSRERERGRVKVGVWWGWGELCLLVGPICAKCEQKHQ